MENDKKDKVNLENEAVSENESEAGEININNNVKENGVKEDIMNEKTYESTEEDIDANISNIKDFQKNSHDMNPDNEKEGLSEMENDQDLSSEIGNDEIETDILKEIHQLSTELEKSKEQTLRLAAELQNTKNIHAREKKEAALFSTTNFSKELLSVIDNFDRAFEILNINELENNESESKDTKFSDDEKINQFIKGMILTKKDMLSMFKRNGIEKIKAEGEVFDPNIHQAISQIEAKEDKDKGKVIQVLQDGYKIHDRILRAAMVVIAK